MRNITQHILPVIVTLSLGIFAIKDWRSAGIVLATIIITFLCYIAIERIIVYERNKCIQRDKHYFVRDDHFIGYKDEQDRHRQSN